MIMTKKAKEHAIKYLSQAKERVGQVGISEIAALYSLNPSGPCKAFGIAKWTLLQSGNIDAAIESLKGK